jgi:hypothetical protein
MARDGGVGGGGVVVDRRLTSRDYAKRRAIAQVKIA